ncbi:MAG: shikimate dehydrogenase [Chloroflexi bacterium]|nr:MAG: shikimate dehydrogenase [Chloroflexota bacterium]TMF78642.1 MAG: shikimate dehydrogenase [Chloroflexota bacterium]TMF91752.1 MAG: shikimate dehydrogenase [Chloroflexota bacterium]TMG46049.1 MAG: shikimate dehydrogenase [Chloroflexota bacterium]
MDQFTFIGVSTQQSAAMRLFPAWATELGLRDVRLVGCDLPIHAERERYREIVEQIRIGKRERGALVTTHKISLFEACRDLFDGVDEYAALCGETSCLAKRNGRLYAWATDPISSGRALAEFYPTAGDSEVLCLGGGGSAVAITVHLLKHSTRSRITVVNRTAGRLEAMRAIHSQLAPAAEVRYVENSDPRTNDRLIGDLPPRSLVINATGMGKDRPGSPITDAAVFPEGAYAWELNYRGKLEFLHQALRQAGGGGMHVEDGWRYFIHGWAVVMEHVFEIAIDGPKLDRLAAVSESERPRRILS